jgi:hypothetical protein
MVSMFSYPPKLDVTIHAKWIHRIYRGNRIHISTNLATPIDERVPSQRKRHWRATDHNHQTDHAVSAQSWLIQPPTGDRNGDVKWPFFPLDPRRVPITK